MPNQLKKNRSSEICENNDTVAICKSVIMQIYNSQIFSSQVLLIKKKQTFIVHNFHSKLPQGYHLQLFQDVLIVL